MNKKIRLSGGITSIFFVILIISPVLTAIFRSFSKTNDLEAIFFIAMLVYLVPWVVISGVLLTLGLLSREKVKLSEWLLAGSLIVSVIGSVFIFVWGVTSS